MRTFSSRLTRRIILILFIIMGILAFLIFVFSASFIHEEECGRYEALRDMEVERVRRVTSDVYVGTANHVLEIEENLSNPDRLFKIMERIVGSYNRIRSCGLSFVADYYPNKGRMFCPYAVRLPDGSIETRDFAASGRDYLEAVWFKEALEAENNFWSEPFFEGGDSATALVPLLFPIHDKSGKTVAVLGADITLDWLHDQLNEIDEKVYARQWGSLNEEKRKRRVAKGKEGKWKPYSFIVTSKGTYLAHPDTSRILRNNIRDLVATAPDTITAFVVGQMLNGRKGYYGGDDEDWKNGVIRSFNFDGRKSYIFYAPIKYSNWRVGLVVPAYSFDIVSYIVGGMLASFVLLALLLVYFICRRYIRSAVKPLHQLANSADEVAQGNFQAPLPDIRHDDEIRQLRDSFHDMQESLTGYIERLKETTASKAAIENELKVAHRIQMNMLPKPFSYTPNESEAKASAAVPVIRGQLTPAKDVGGDLYDYFVRGDSLFFCIGDVSGKGVPAALVMAVTRSLFRNISAHTAEPHQIMTALNNALSESNDANMFVTLFVGALQLETGKLRYCNAGHDAPLLVGQGVGLLPCLSNLPVGAMPGIEYEPQEADICPHTTIFLYTDGLTEAEGLNHVQFGLPRVLSLTEQLLAEHRHHPDILISEMEKTVHQFVGEAEKSDDLTMLAIQYEKDSNEELS